MYAYVICIFDWVIWFQRFLLFSTPMYNAMFSGLERACPCATFPSNCAIFSRLICLYYQLILKRLQCTMHNKWSMDSSSLLHKRHQPEPCQAIVQLSLVRILMDTASFTNIFVLSDYLIFHTAFHHPSLFGIRLRNSCQLRLFFTSQYSRTQALSSMPMCIHSLCSDLWPHCFVPWLILHSRSSHGF